MTLCEFERRGDKLVCTRCARSLPDRGRPVKAQCRVTTEPANPKSLTTEPLTCTHRGEVARLVKCPTCNNATFDLPIYSCAVHGECTLEAHGHRNAELLNTKVCRYCPDRKAAEPQGPSLIAKAANYAAAQLRDRMSGRRRRSPELIARIFDRHCRVCPRFNAETSECAECGCPVMPHEPEANKLAWANEQCPIGKWPIQRANLIYYLLPLSHPDNVWQWHVAQLRQRLHIFNGRRIVWVATPGPREFLNLEPEKVIAEFGDDAASIEFHFAPNDRDYWETPAFRTMLRALAYDLPVAEAEKRPRMKHGPNTDGAEDNDIQNPCSIRVPSVAEAAFYFHAKGVRRATFASSIKPWCEAIYYHNLDRWDEVREILSVWPCCGIARQAINPTTMGGDGWHFAGSGFWFNHAALFERGLRSSAPSQDCSGLSSHAEAKSTPKTQDLRPTASAASVLPWDSIQDHSHAVEAYLATQFRFEEAYCLAHDNAGASTGGVYNAATWLNWRSVDRPSEIAGRGFRSSAVGFRAQADAATKVEERQPKAEGIRAEITTRNLIYHVAPFKSNDTWQRNVGQLMKRIEQFNGRRVVAIATGEGMEDARAVKAAFGGAVREFILVPNDRRLRERASFGELLEAVKSTDPHTATFYAHAKGVTTTGDVRGVMYWRNAMYHELLDDADKIAHLLRLHPCVGTHRLHRAQYPDGLNTRTWHYAGAFFWFRNDALYSQADWKAKIPDSGWGVEAYPGVMFRYEDTSCVFMDEPTNCYDPAQYAEPIADDEGEPTAASAVLVELMGDRPQIGDGFKGYRIDLAVEKLKLPFADGAVDRLYGDGILQRVRDLRGLLRELARSCRQGAMIELRVPHWNSPQARSDGNLRCVTLNDVERWTIFEVEKWFGGGERRLRLTELFRTAAKDFAGMRSAFTGWTDAEILERVPGACLEYRLIFHAVPNADGLAAAVDCFDEASYLEANPDVAADVRRGRWSSGKEHYQQYGFKEGRSPRCLI
jgi:hypothetical protein